MAGGIRAWDVGGWGIRDLWKSGLEAWGVWSGLGLGVGRGAWGLGVLGLGSRVDGPGV